MAQKLEYIYTIDACIVPVNMLPLISYLSSDILKARSSTRELGFVYREIAGSEVYT